MRILTLTTSQVEASMAGNYTCKPYNSWGSSGTSTVIRVVVEEQEETEEDVDKEPSLTSPQELPQRSAHILGQPK